MTTDVLSELDASLRGFLLDRYTTTVGTSPAEGAFVALQPGGLPLSDEMFKLRPTDATYSPNKATEEISRKTDVIGQVDAGLFRAVLSSVSELAGFAADSFSPPGVSTEIAQLMESMRAAAKRKLADTELSSYRLGGLRYHPAFASPEAWYDAQAATAWTSTNLSATETETSDPVELPAEPLAPWSWQVAPFEHRDLVVDPRRFAAFAADLHLAAEVSEDVRLQRLVDIDPAVRATMLESALAPRAELVLGHRGGADVLVPPEAVVVTPELARVDETIVALARSEGRRSLGRPEARPDRGDGGDWIEPVHDKLGDVVLALDIQVAAQAYDSMIQESQPQPVESSNITLSFDYTLVTLDRQWFPAALVANGNWYVPGYRAGQLLSPRSPSARPAMPVAFVAVRRLRLAGTWSSRDIEALPASMSVGPLSLVGRTITTTNGSVVVESDGMQIVAWICQPLPTLPPLDDPALA